MSETIEWEYMLLRTRGGQEIRTSVRKAPDAKHANAFLDRWMRAKLAPRSIDPANWRQFAVWSGDSVTFLGDVESVHWLKDKE